MSGASLLGLLAFVAVFTAAGAGVLTAIRGLQPLRSWPGDLGLAYLMGVAALGGTLTLEVILGVPLSLGSILVTAALLAGGGVAVGRRRTPPHTAAPMPPAGRVDYLAAAALAVVTVVVLAAYFRSARLHGLFGWDAGSFWVPKAIAIFSTGGLEPEHFSTLPGPSYPPLVPVLQATSFHFMGGVDVVALHLLYWSLLAGFVAAAVRLLAPLARPALAWGGVLAVIVADQIGRDALTPQADVVMDLFLGLGVLFLVCWLLRQRSRAIRRSAAVPQRCRADEARGIAVVPLRRRSVARGHPEPSSVDLAARRRARRDPVSGHRSVADLVHAAFASR